MSLRISNIYFSLFVLLFFSCNHPKETKPKIDKTASTTETIHKFDDKKKEFKPISYQFIADSILQGYKDVLRFYFSRYAPDTCTRGFYDSTFFRNYEGMSYIGDINRNGLIDSFFVLYPI